MRRRRLVIVTNIPTPYRIYFFEELYQLAQRHDLDVEVLFMASTERGRWWKFDPSVWKFPHRIIRGVHYYWRDVPLHFNPGVYWYLWRRPPDWLMLGGSWAMPTSALLAIGRRWLVGRSRVLWWLEANESSMRYRDGLIAWLRRFIVTRADALVLPGEVARQWADSFVDKTVPRLHLPNLVDERIYRDRVDEVRATRAEQIRRDYGLLPDQIVALLPARLAPEKNVVGFLETLKFQWPEKLRLLIAGDGPLRSLVERIVREGKMENVTFRGHCDTEGMIEMYAIADILVLPSFRDQNPLVVIEALWAGLPVLISRRVGNWPEAVEEGRNGWTFDPGDPHEVLRAVTRAVSTGRDGLRSMGLRSREIAQARFESKRAIAQFVEELLGLC